MKLTDFTKFRIPFYFYEDYDFNDSPSHRFGSAAARNASTLGASNGGGGGGSLGRILSALNPFTWIGDEEQQEVGEEELDNDNR